MKKFWQRILNALKQFFGKIGAFIKKIIAPISKRYQKLPNRTKKSIQGYLYILPWIIGILLFGVYQIAHSFRISMAKAARFVVDPATSTVIFKTDGFGFKQYVDIFKNNPDHVDVIVNSALDILLVVILVIIFSLLLALLLKQKIKGSSIFRTIFFIPVILLSGNMLTYFAQYGLLAMPSASSEGIIEAIEFYFSGVFADIIFGAFYKIILILWLSGVQTLIFLSALQKVDPHIYEAAAIDGASGWESFWKITLPLMFPFMTINIIYTTVVYSSLSDLLNLIFVCLPDPLYGRAYASALSWILFLIELAVIGFYTLLIRLSSRKYR
ncbi:MAG: sugar ABC transporter permease [Acholeplasmataceae bacterium]|jgi:oligogalacturonide transport system permease protein|nr:sugar ABC transporter permease [Acholeplasmataceae bacterium]